MLGIIAASILISTVSTTTATITSTAIRFVRIVTIAAPVLISTVSTTTATITSTAIRFVRIVTIAAPVLRSTIRVLRNWNLDAHFIVEFSDWMFSLVQNSRKVINSVMRDQGYSSTGSSRPSSSPYSMEIYQWISWN